MTNDVAYFADHQCRSLNLRSLQAAKKVIRLNWLEEQATNYKSVGT